MDPVDWREYLKVPTPTRPSIAAASRTIVARTGDNPYAIAQGIQDWLETEFIYDLTYQAPQHTNAVEHYLEHKHGACDMIATAMALLARHNEIPARVAVGFGPGVATGRDLWTIRMRDAHAWPSSTSRGMGGSRSTRPCPRRRSILKPKPWRSRSSACASRRGRWRGWPSA